MTEIIDIFDANMVPTGTMERNAAQLAGEWYRTFHFWLVSPLYGGSIIWQMRSKHKSHHGAQLGMTAGGHFQAGESLQDGLREVVEEIGVDFKYSDIEFLGWNTHVRNEGQKILRRFEAVHMARWDGDIESLHPTDPIEVGGLVWVPITDCFKIFMGQPHSVICDAFLHDETKNAYVRCTQKVDLSTFVVDRERYLLTVSIMAERLLEGRRPLSI